MKTDFQPNINLSFIRGGLAHVGVKNTLYENWCIFNRVNLENKFYLPVRGEGEIFIKETGMTPMPLRKKYAQNGFFSVKPNHEYKKQKRLKSNRIYSFKP